MKSRESIAWLLVVVLGACLYLMQPEKEVITLPSRTNTKVITTPQPIKRKDTLVLSGGGTQIVFRRNPVSAESLSRFKEADSTAKDSLFRDAITEREYHETLEDSVQRIFVRTEVIGRMKFQEISYKTKPVKLETKSKRKLKSFSVGTFALLPSQYDSSPFTLGAKVDVELEKINFSVGMDLNKRAFLGVSMKIFDSQK